MARILVLCDPAAPDVVADEIERLERGVKRSSCYGVLILATFVE